MAQTKFKINYKDKEQLIKDVHYVANHLFPLKDEPYKTDTDISKSNYKLTVIQGGITNLLYLMTPNDDIKVDDKDDKDDKDKNVKKLLVRVYGENTEVLINREREEKLFNELGELGFGPTMYGLFGNGRIEQWYDNAHSQLLHERKHCKKIAARLAEMHSIHPKLLKDEETQSSLWQTINKWYDIASNVEFKDENEKQIKYEQLNWENRPKQINLLKSILPSDENDNIIDKLFEFIIAQQSKDKQKEIVDKRLNNLINKIAWSFMSDFVFSHNDLLGGNVLYLEDRKYASSFCKNVYMN